MANEVIQKSEKIYLEKLEPKMEICIIMGFYIKCWSSIHGMGDSSLICDARNGITASHDLFRCMQLSSFLRIRRAERQTARSLPMSNGVKD
jgi:hypothetical protein